MTVSFFFQTLITGISNGMVAYQALLASTPSDGHAFIVSDGSML